MSNKSIKNTPNAYNNIWTKAKELVKAYQGQSITAKDYIDMINFPVKPTKAQIKTMSETDVQSKGRASVVKNQFSDDLEKCRIAQLVLDGSGSDVIKDVSGIMHHIGLDIIKTVDTPDKREIKFYSYPENKYYFLKGTVKFSKNRFSKNKQFNGDVSGLKSINKSGDKIDINGIVFQIINKDYDPTTYKLKSSGVHTPSDTSVRDVPKKFISSQYIIKKRQQIDFDPITAKNYLPVSPDALKTVKILGPKSWPIKSSAYTIINDILAKVGNINGLTEIKFDTPLDQIQTIIEILNTRKEEFDLKPLMITNLKYVFEDASSVSKEQNKITKQWDNYRKVGGKTPGTKNELHNFKKSFKQRIYIKKISRHLATLMDRFKEDNRIDVSGDNQKYIIHSISKSTPGKFDHKFKFKQYNYIETPKYNLKTPFTASDIFFRQFKRGEYGFNIFQITDIDEITDLYNNVELFKSNLFTFIEILLSLNRGPSVKSDDISATEITFKKKYLGTTISKNVKDMYLSNGNSSGYEQFYNENKKYTTTLYYHFREKYHKYYFKLGDSITGNTIISNAQDFVNISGVRTLKYMINIWDPCFLKNNTSGGPYTDLDTVINFSHHTPKLGKIHKPMPIINTNLSFGGFEQIIEHINYQYIKFNMENPSSSRIPLYSLIPSIEFLIKFYTIKYDGIHNNYINLAELAKYKYDLETTRTYIPDFFPELGISKPEPKQASVGAWGKPLAISNKYYEKYIKYKNKYLSLKKQFT